MPDTNYNSKDNSAPEEKLLRLIRKDKKILQSKAAKDNSDKDSSAADSKIAIVDSDKIKESPILFSFIEHINFSFINMLITLFVAISAAIFILTFLSQPIKSGSVLNNVTAGEKNELIQEREILPLEYYQDVISKRVLFRGGQKDTKESQLIPKSKTFSQLLQGLNLIGIMSGDNPRAIIEDKKENQTYFVYRGDYLGEIKVVDIEVKKVTMEYQGETASLFL